MRLWLFILFLLLLSPIAHGQKLEKYDSLRLVLSTMPQDTSRMRMLTTVMNLAVSHDLENVHVYRMEAEQLSQQLNWPEGDFLLNRTIGRLYWRLGEFDTAIGYHKKALQWAKDVGGEARQSDILILIGQDYGDSGNYDEALRYFTEAEGIFHRLGNERGLAGLYNLMVWVYNNQGRYVEASRLNYQILSLYEKQNDEYGVATTKSNLAANFVKLGNYDQALIYLAESTEVFIKLQDWANVGLCYVDMGDVYLTLGSHDQARINLDKGLKFSQRSRDTYGIAYAQLFLAKLEMKLGNYEAARENLRSGATLFGTINEKQYLSSAYAGLGICYIRLNDYIRAEAVLDSVLILGNELGSMVTLEEYYKGRHLLDSATGKWQDAYSNLSTYYTIRDSLMNAESSRKLMQSQVQYEFDKKEAVAKVEQEKKDARQRTIRNSIAAALAGSLIFLVVVYIQRNKISRARRRSDELLLNILPREVADELKEKGRANARQFDEVTVMFTDFKGFTQISEKYTPAEIVSEIDNCFRAFDEIITRHNIEKIKTIGDSYMCAGGLPVANQTHAVDVVRAALEINEFMHEHIRERREAGKEVFEIRIGIHTGPVVAGIVGVKKFAYDIWGDTVNLASRMESSGEPGKVNISASTYALIRDQFRCEYRGKVAAKNKGEIDMYFVEDATRQ